MNPRALRVVLATLAAAFAMAPAASAAAPGQVDSVGLPRELPASMSVPPPGFSTNARQAIAIAERTPAVRKALRDHPGLRSEALVWDHSRWEVNFKTAQRTYVEVDVTAGGAVEAIWTGLQAEAYFARGGSSGLFDSPWVWLPFALLFVAPFVDVRRPLRLLHLDLLMLLSFGASYWFFRRGDVEPAVALVYPALAYLLVRLLVAGLRGGRARGALVPFLPTWALVVGVLALAGARVGLDVASDNVIDVGYASVVGADRVAHHEQLYVDNDVHGDTYGPVNYLAYVPFEAVFPWTGAWDSVPAARAAAITFDLLTLLGLLLLGRNLRDGPAGRRLGLAMAWAWAAFPFSLFGLMMNTNDGLVAMLSVFALVAFSSPLGRGGLLGLAIAAKFFPAALIPLFARGRDEGRKAWAICAGAAVAVTAFTLLLYLPPGGLRELWNCTLGYQLGRPADFSLWGLHANLGWAQKALEVAGAALALGVALVPGRRRSTVQIAALAGAVMIALQLPAGHWFYYYIMWFAPLAFVALFGGRREIGPPAPATHGAAATRLAPALRDQPPVPV